MVAWSKNQENLGVSQHLECPSCRILRVQNSVYSQPGGACWAAGQSGAQGPVMCGAGLHLRAWGGAVGVGELARMDFLTIRTGKLFPLLVGSVRRLIEQNPAACR